MKAKRESKILIVGDFSFSRGAGSSNYVIGLGNALRGAGFEVQYLSGCPDQGPIRDDFQPHACHVAPDERLLRGWKYAWSRVSASGNKAIEWLDQQDASDAYVVIAYPESRNSVGFLLKLRRLCRQRSWKLMVVVVEWYGFRRSGGWPHRLLAILDTEVQLRFLNKQIRRIIAVSSFLERYYRRSGCDVIRIPPLIDAQAKKWNCRPTTALPKSDLTLLFSGSWCRDRLDLIMEAVGHLRRDGNKIVLKFLGSDPNELQRSPKLRRQLAQAPAGTFEFNGWVPFERALPVTASADFGVLLRDRAKWSDACFPSKVSEFQALGVPLLCNLTSDLDQVLRDGDNALIVPHVSVAAFVSATKRALALTPSERGRLKQRSLQCAATQHDYRNYAGRLGDFIRRI